MDGGQFDAMGSDGGAVALVEGRVVHGVAALTEAMNDPAFYQRDGAAITAHGVELAAVQAELDAAYARWEALEQG